MSYTIQFNHKGYDPFIDFIKAYAIVCVILAHGMPREFFDITLFRIWGGMQVPLFVLVQVFHAYKKGTPPHFEIFKDNKKDNNTIFLDANNLYHIILFYTIAFWPSRSI